MNPLDQKSPYGGRLIEEVVHGATSGNLNPENNVDVNEGADRSMYVYVPASGCPHAKQTAVLMVLRDSDTRGSAEKLMGDLGLADLAEREHFVLLFPNPQGDGWNYERDHCRDDDMQFLVRCFAVLKGSRGGVAGFNGMMYYIAASQAASAMLWVLSRERPLDTAAIMIGAFPREFVLSEGSGAEQVAWFYEDNSEASEALARVNGSSEFQALTGEKGISVAISEANPAVRYFESANGLCAAEVARAWDSMFARVRRWRNDTLGTYQERPDFEGRGFVAHVDDASLGLKDGLGRTWFEYVPEPLRTASNPMPLVLYFHGINCCGLYGAEQSGWADIADRDGFACVFPNATTEERWNAWGDSRIPSDIDYVMALIDHMCEIYPIDRSRIYISGFSMGSMFSNALACSYPEVFAGVVALNGPNLAYLQTLDEAKPGMLAFRPNSALREIPNQDEEKSPTRLLADSKKGTYDWRMPFVQFVGLLDGVGFESGKAWPVLCETDSQWVPTVAYWKKYDGIANSSLFDPSTPTGFASDRVEEIGRFVHQSWRGVGDEVPPIDSNALYHLIAARRMPHAVDLREVAMGWNIVKHYRREPDGSLAYAK